MAKEIVLAANAWNGKDFETGLANLTAVAEK
jgi:hypothetical protein